MKLTISFKELETIIKEKKNFTVGLSKGDGGNVIKVSTLIEKKVPFLGVISKELSAQVTVDGISGLDLSLSYDFGNCMDIIINGAKMLIGDYVEKTDVLSWGKQDNQVILHIDKIAKKQGFDDIDKVTRYININGLAVVDDGVELLFTPKLA